MTPVGPAGDRIRTSGVPGGHLRKRVEEEETDATKKRDTRTVEATRVGGWIGQEGERRKSCSAGVTDGIKRKAGIFVGYSIVRKTDSRMSKGGVLVCLHGARIEHVVERIEQVMGIGKRGSKLVHIGQRG